MPLQRLQKYLQLPDDLVLAFCVGVEICPHPQPGFVRALYIAGKIRIHIGPALVAGAHPDDGELLARRGHGEPVHHTPITGYIDPFLKHGHYAPLLARIVCGREPKRYTTSPPFTPSTWPVI